MKTGECRQWRAEDGPVQEGAREIKTWLRLGCRTGGGSVEVLKNYPRVLSFRLADLSFLWCKRRRLVRDGDLQVRDLNQTEHLTAEEYNEYQKQRIARATKNGG